MSRLRDALSVHERKPLSQNELRVGCPRMSVHVHGQIVGQESEIRNINH